MFSLLMLASALFLVACEKQQEQPQLQVKATSQNLRPVIYYATFEEWGHASANCGGWGLCRYSDCWFCNAPDNARKARVEFDADTNEGNLFIELNPAVPIEQEAITRNSIFYVDGDIDNPNSVLHGGKYALDATVGKYGGYRIPITIKKN